MGFCKDKLSFAEREKIARELFQVDNKISNKEELRGLCPVHKEKNPSFGYNVKKDVGNCLACGFCGDLIAIYCKVKGYSDNKEGFKAFCECYGIETNKKSNARTDNKKSSVKKEDEPLPDLDGDFKLLPPLPDNWIKRLIETRGWSQEVIQKTDLRLQTHYRAKKTGKLVKIKKPERIAIPVKDESGVCRNIRLYKPGGGNPKIMSWGAKYGSVRLFPDTPQMEGIILVCEGEPDTLCALSYGFNAITQTTKPHKWPKKHMERFKGRTVIFAYDADQAGQKYARIGAHNLSNVARSVALLEWPDWMGRQEDGQWPKDHGEDLTDFFVKHKKKAADLQQLIDEAKLYEDDQTKEFTEARPERFFTQNINGRVSFKPSLVADYILEKMSLLSDPSTGLLYRWNGRFHKVYHEDHVKKLVQSELGDESSKGRIENSFFEIKVRATLPDDKKLNDDENLICTRNGMLNLKTLQIRPHSQKYYYTCGLDVEFNPDSKAKCYRWLQFLDETVQTPEVINQLQEFAGYCLTRETRFSKCLFLIGPGADGKSIFLKTLRHLVGPDNCSTVSFIDLEKDFQRSALYNKNLNISTEIGSKALESPDFKAIVSGDPINAAFKFKDQFSFIPYCKLAFAANRLPRVLDNSDGFFRRVLPVRFKRQFLENDPKTDPYLLDALKAEISEIFHWSLVGLHRLWENNRFTDCEETREIMRGYRRLNNPVVCFIEDHCTLGPTESTARAELYSAFNQFCSKNKYRPLSRENFYRELFSAYRTIGESRPRKGGQRIRHLKGISVDLSLEG